MNKASQDLRDALLGDVVDLGRAAAALAQGADVNAYCFVDNQRMPLLHAVVLMNDPCALAFLLQQPRLNVDCVGNEGFNALMIAALKHAGPLDTSRFGDVVDMLLNAGISLDHKDDDGDTIFDYARPDKVYWLHPEKSRRLAEACQRAQALRADKSVVTGVAAKGLGKPMRIRKAKPPGGNNSR